MKYFVPYFLTILAVIISLMPVWIKLVYRTVWPLFFKRATTLIMVLSSTLISLALVFKPNPFPTAKILGTVVVMIYLILVITTAYRNWPR
jgi:hypothetical protein